MKSYLGLIFCFLPVLTPSVAFRGESECHNTCPHPKRVNFVAKCHCDAACAVTYNDCCYDSPYRMPVPPGNVPHRGCLYVAGEDKYLHVTNKCRKGWKRDQDVIDRCKKTSWSSPNIDNLQDHVPVTSGISGVTYKNLHCAICSEDMDDMVFWTIKIHCDDVEDVIIRDVKKILKLNKVKQQWDVDKTESASRRTVLYECKIAYHRPPGISEKAFRDCVPGLISSCPPDWKDAAVKRKCKSYVNPVYWSRGEGMPTVSYRNIYCALCNNETGTAYWCEMKENKRPRVSLGNVFKRVDSKCEENEVYDSTTKSCRRILCLKKGQIVRNGKCVSPR